ncbi:MAG: protein translocase subunit SecF [bacterium]|nr:protein translocase subunit SecF [bacterium]
MNLIRYSPVFIVCSLLFVLSAVIALLVFRLNLGIDFMGGSIMEVEYQGILPQQQDLEGILKQFGAPSIQPIGEKGYIFRMGYLAEDVHQEVLRAIDLGQGVTEKKFEAIGPVIGNELRNKTLLMIVLSALGIALYIAMAFRKSSLYIQSFQYSAVALLVTLHDVIIPIGAFALLGKLYGTQITIPIIVGLLTVLGYSINDTIVVFDRIRENITKRSGIDLADTVNKSINQTFGRSVSTSSTVLLVLAALYFFGGATLKDFSLVLIIGVIAGTYSSIFLAPPLLVWWKQGKGAK